MVNSKVFELAKSIIEDKQGECLSTDCNNQYDKISVKCDQGHVWQTTPKNIKNGGWCPECYNSRRSQMKLEMHNKLPEVISFMEKKGGKCISTEYKGRHEKMLFECEKGHQWESSWASIQQNCWCHVCQNISFTESESGRKTTIISKYTLEDIQKICKEKNGECLSDQYISSKMKFKCHFGHEWEASAGNIIGRNSWCPICSSSLYERICRLYFETLFDKKFTTSYPKWLKNKNNEQLELDGYCEELNLAFEHNGKQHYQEVNFNGKSSEFEKLKENDKEKISLCKENNVNLIIIPELFSMTKIDDLKSFIKEQCINFNVLLPDNYDEITVDYKLIYLSNKEIEKFNILKEKLLNKGYELLSTEYIGSGFYYDVKCLNCNTVKSSQYNNLLIHNCLQCQGIKKRNDLQDAIDLAKSKNGLCLSTDYKDNHTKMLWQCELGHKWESTYNNIQKCWCPECFKLNRGKSKKLSIDVYQSIAKSKGGECLSTEINSCYDKLEWKCCEGHIWFSRADAIKNTKQWCPICAKENKKKVKEK